MATTDRRVVVISPVSKLYDAGWRTHVAALPKLGLAAFGDSKDIALARLKESFREFVDIHRSNGVLEETLDGMDVKWYWEDEYPDDAPAYEDTSPQVNEPPEAVAVQQTQVEGPLPPVYSGASSWLPAEIDLFAANDNLAAAA